MRCQACQPFHSSNSTPIKVRSFKAGIQSKDGTGYSISSPIAFRIPGMRMRESCFRPASRRPRPAMHSPLESQLANRCASPLLHRLPTWKACASIAGKSSYHLPCAVHEAEQGSSHLRAWSISRITHCDPKLANGTDRPEKHATHTAKCSYIHRALMLSNNRPGTACMRRLSEVTLHMRDPHIIAYTKFCAEASSLPHTALLNIRAA